MAGPSRWWYALAVGFLVAGAVGGTYGLLRTKRDIDGMPRVVMPGEANLYLDEGGYLAFYEQDSVVAGEVFHTGAFGPLQCTMREQGGDAVVLNPTDSAIATSYRAGRYAGSAVFGFDAPHRDYYRLRCDFAGPAPGRLVIAIGLGLGNDIVLTVVAALGPGILGLGAFLVIFFWRRAVRRSALEA